jgi:hypothetical protein
MCLMLGNRGIRMVRLLLCHEPLSCYSITFPYFFNRDSMVAYGRRHACCIFFVHPFVIYNMVCII